MFLCVWLHFKKIFGKYFLMFGCILENTIKNTFFTCCSHFLTFSQLPNKHIMSFIPKNSNKTQDKSFSRWKNPEGHLRTRWDRDRSDLDRDRDRRDLDRRDRDRNLADLDRERDRDRDRAKRRSTLRARSARSRSQSRWFRWSRSTPIGAIAIAIVIDVDRRSSGDRRDRDRGASVWVVPAQWRLDDAVKAWQSSACVRGSCVWERGGNQLKWK